MPSTPTTKSQVQAYQFVLRRMQSALVRRDAVMLHDPMRTHSRATVVGVVLGVLGVAVFTIWGLLSPQPSVPNSRQPPLCPPEGQVMITFSLSGMARGGESLLSVRRETRVCPPWPGWT